MSWDILPKANLQYFLQKLKGKLDAIRQGHVIIADGGTSLPQEDNLQFGGVYVHDDSTNDKTKVDVVREFQSVAEIEALTGEAKKGFEVIEDNEEYIPYTGSDILFDNTDTSFEGENVQEVLEEVDTALDDVNSIGVIPATAETGVTNSSIVYKKSDNELIISVDVTFSSVVTMWNNAFTVNIPNKQCTGVFGTANNGGLIQAYGENILTVRLNNVSANTVYRGQIIVPLLNL